MICLEAKNIVKFFGNKKVLDNISFKLECGKTYILLGPNGAGKSTTLKILSGLLRFNSGEINILGYNIKEINKVRKYISYLPEDPVPFLNLTVRENLDYVRILKGIENKEIVDEFIEKFNLKEYENNLSINLSKGNKQKLCIAMSLIGNPKIILLDEPLNYVDIQSQRTIINILKEYEKNGSTIFVSTHILSLAEEIGNYVFLLNNGKIIYEGDINKIKDKGEKLENIIINILNDIR